MTCTEIFKLLLLLLLLRLLLFLLLLLTTTHIFLILIIVTVKRKCFIRIKRLPAWSLTWKWNQHPNNTVSLSMQSIIPYQLHYQIYQYYLISMCRRSLYITLTTYTKVCFRNKSKEGRAKQNNVRNKPPANIRNIKQGWKW